MEEESFETLDELHESILSLCQDDDEETKNGISDHLAETPQNVCSTPGPNLEAKHPKEKDDSSLFRLSPSKMSGIHLPVLENKRLSCLQTPLSLAGLSPIVSMSTPNLKSRVRHFSSTPCVGPYQPKRLSLNQTEQQTMITISEIGESFMEQTKTVENLGSTNKSKVSKDQASKIDEKPLTKAVNIIDNNYFKDTSKETARFSGMNFSQMDGTIVVEDDMAELTADILGLENYIVLDSTSQENEDTIMEETEELGSTSIFGAETIPVKSSVLLTEETIAVNCTNLKDTCSVKKEICFSPGKGKNIATVTPMVHDVRIPSPTLEKPKEQIESQDDSVIEVIMVDESVEVIDISDDSIACDKTVIEVSAAYQDPKANQAYMATGPSGLRSSSKGSTGVSTSSTHPSVATTPITSTVTSVSHPQMSVSPHEPPYTPLNEEELMKLVKSKWGTDPVHDVNNNLTLCSYRHKQAPNVQNSILEETLHLVDRRSLQKVTVNLKVK